MTPKRSRGTWGSISDVEALYGTYLDAVREFCRQQVADTSLADDLAQEAFKRTLERRDAEGFRRRPRRSLFREARLLCLEHQRRREREPVALGIVLTESDDPAAVVSEHLELRDHLEQLTEPQKTVLAHIFAGYEVKEIARRVGWPYGTVASRLGRLRDTARRREEELRAFGLLWLGRRRWRLDPTLGQHASVALTAVAALLVATPPSAAGADRSITPPAAVASAGPSIGPAAVPADARRPVAEGAVLVEASPPRATAAASAPPAVVHPLLPLLPSETPEDTDVTAITASPHYQQDHTVVALGLGHACACQVLLRSTDGGASWDSTAVAATGDQVVLPPTFPTDPRIFIGAEPSATSVDWVSAGWGQPFTPLALPPGAAGHLAIVSNQLLSVGNAAVWSLPSGSSVAVPVLAYSGQQPATIAATPEAAYILAPAHAVGAGIATGISPGLFVCAPGCRYVGAVPLPGVGPLAVGGATVAAAAGSAVVLSQDGGASFQSVSPANAAQLPSADAVAVNSMAAWVIGQAGAQMRPTSSGRWQPLTVDQAVRALVPLSTTRLIATLRLAGLRCSTDGGATWTPRCAPEP